MWSDRLHPDTARLWDLLLFPNRPEVTLVFVLLKGLNPNPEALAVALGLNPGTRVTDLESESERNGDAVPLVKVRPAHPNPVLKQSALASALAEPRLKKSTLRLPKLISASSVPKTNIDLLRALQQVYIT